MIGRLLHFAEESFGQFLTLCAAALWWCLDRVAGLATGADEDL